MRKVLRRVLSPPMVIAVVALVVAAGGTGYAVTRLPSNSVGTVQIRTHAVTTPKLATTVAARIAGLTYKTATVMAPPGTAGVISVTAPSGTTAIAGGVETQHTMDAFLLDSHPNKTGWEASVANTSTVPQPITVYAICARVQGGAARASAARTTMIHRFAFTR